MGSVDPVGLRSGLGALDGRELAGRLVEIERAVRALEAAAVSVIAEADRRDVFREDGHVSVRGWVHATVRSSDVDVRHRVRTARLCSDLPVVLDALGDGDVGVAQVRELARARANRRCGDELGDVVEPLLEVAASQPFDTFAQVVRQWERLADADGAHREADHAHDARHASVTDVDGTTYVAGVVGAAQGALIADVFDAYTRAEFDAEWDELRARLGGDACPDLLERSERQRRADALVAIFTAARRGLGADGAPTVDVLVDQHVFDEQLAAMIEDRAPRFDAGDIWRDRCRTASGAPVDPADAVAAAVVGHVRRVVLDGTGVIVDVGRRQRCFTGSTRAAALLQAAIDRVGGCWWPGCRNRHVQVDHVIPWSHDGPTGVANSGPLCPRHNRWKTRGYHTWRDPDGTWHVRRPDGTHLDAA